jgi:hypothetical protein
MQVIVRVWFLDEARASTFLRDALIRAKLAGVEAPPAGVR